VHFALAATAVLTVRDALRRAGPRLPPRVAAAAALGAPVTGAAVALLVYAAQTRGVRSAYGDGLAGVLAASVLELCAEPFHAAAAAAGAHAPRLAAETAAAGVRAAVAGLLLLGPSAGGAWPVEAAFARAQLAGAVTLVTVYLLSALFSRSALWPPPPLAPDAAQRALLRSFGLQAAWKLGLAEGDRAVALAARALSPAGAGALGLASNLGALVARLLLAPLEEAAFCAFARAARTRSCTVPLTPLLQPLALAGLAAAAVGPSYARLALRLLYGAGWAANRVRQEKGALGCGTR